MRVSDDDLLKDYRERLAYEMAHPASAVADAVVSGIEQIPQIASDAVTSITRFASDAAKAAESAIRPLVEAPAIATPQQAPTPEASPRAINVARVVTIASTPTEEHNPDVAAYLALEGGLTVVGPDAQPRRPGWLGDSVRAGIKSAFPHVKWTR